MADWLLGIDDTDVRGHKPGTGRLARELGAHLEQANLARLRGVVRQQLFVDPRIPYTSHNSPACLMLSVDAAEPGTVHRLFDAAARYVVACSAPGSDPGLCLVEETAVAGDVRHFGVRASTEVVGKADALALAAREGIRLEELGGSGDGVIGALASVGLTAAGSAGRFLEYVGGLRGLGESLQAGALRRRGIALLNLGRNAEPIPDDAMIWTGDRLRPRLLHGQPVLLVEGDVDGWRCYDRKSPHTDGEERGDG
jgi:hypothetical protein